MSYNIEKFNEVLNNINIKKQNDIYDMYNIFIKNYVGWRKLDQKEKKEIKNKLYKIFYENKNGKTFRR